MKRIGYMIAYLRIENLLDFIKRMDQKYDDSIKQIFLILDNVTIHESNKVKAVLSKYHPRIHLVFLPTRSPELNLIEVRWLWMQRQAINNSTFQNERDIGKAVSDWACDYNKKHKGKTSINSLHGESIHVYITVNSATIFMYLNIDLERLDVLK